LCVRGVVVGSAPSRRSRDLSQDVSRSETMDSTADDDRSVQPAQHSGELRVRLRARPVAV
jgi:hypothetical protein